MLSRNIILILFSIISFAFSGIVNPETGWEYQQSTFQAFYMLESTQVDELEVQPTDVIAAFKGDLCLGWVYADSEGYTTIPVMGDDGSDYSDGYLTNDEIPNIVIYDSTHGSILSLDVSATSVDLDGDFEDDLFGELPGWSNNEIFIINGTSSASNTFGCPEESACNYNSDVTADDGSCWSASDGCLCSDGEGSETDCAGVCNGSSELDDCGICDGGNADQDCAGECFGDSSADGCGVCDSDSANDDVTCTGCTDECADNYDIGNLFDDGSCAYTIPEVQNFINTPGECRVTLSWDAPEVCGPSLSYEVYDSNNNFIKQTSQTTTQILDLEADTQHCFFVVATNENATSSPSEIECSLTGSDCGGFVGIQLTTSINGWGFIQEIDSYNYIGFSGSATNGFDETLDIVEPPTSPDNWISLFFPHPEWGSSLGSNFTQDIRPEDYDFLSQDLQIWTGEIISNMSGNAALQLDYLEGLSEALGSIPVYIEMDGEYTAVQSGTTLEFYMFQGVVKHFSIIIGNIAPQPISNLSALGGNLSANLDWDESEDCCITSDGRYPATSYNIYFDTGEDSANTLESEYNHTLLTYETEYCFTVKAVNDAGESPGVSACATTDDNLDPIANAGEDRYVYVEHDGNLNTSEVSVSLEGLGDDPEGSEITYSWAQVSGDLVDFESSNSLVNFDVSNPFGNDLKVYVFELTVFDTYLTGNPAEITSHSNTDLVSVFVTAEQNSSPLASSAIELIVLGDGEATYTSEDLNDGNDYDSETSYWVVPHDGNPISNEANLIFSASSSSDPDDDELSFNWSATFAPEEFTDLNGDGMYSPIEPFIDSNGNGIWDSGIEFFEGSNLLIERSEGFYEVVLTVTDIYGASSSSEVVIGVQSEHNESPSAFAGTDQEWFMPNDLDSKDITVNDNSGQDPDNDGLLFNWSADGFESIGDSSGGWLALVQSLPEGDHTFTFTTTDSYGASASDDVTISILNEPASAAVTNISTAHGLYYAEISFDEGVLEEDDRYTGDLNNSVGYDIFRDGELLVTLDDAGEASFYYLDNGIASSTTFSYDVQSFNSDERRGDAISASETTGDRPTVEVLSPNGAEIWSVGDDYPVDVSTDNREYISDIEVLYSADGGATWTSSGSIGSQDESTSISSDGSEINYDAMVKVVVTDVGDFHGENKDSNEDSSDNSFTMAAHTLSKNYWTGWHMFGAPLVPSLETIDDFMSPVGSFGSDWIIFNGQGLYQNLDLDLGTGYYLALSNNSTLSVDGNPITSNNLELADLELSKGWNLVSHPLTSIVSKTELIIIDDGVEHTWDDAVYWGLISPTLYSWSNNSYQSLTELTPWAGFWVNTSRDLTVKVRPHLSLDGSARIADNTFSINLSAESVDGLSGGDFLQMSVKEGANDSFRYGEDEFDHPNPAMDSFIDLYFDKSEWLGMTDQNGVMVDNPYFNHDVRSLDSDAQAWNIKGNLYNVSGDIELSWTMDESDQEAHLLILGEAYNMREVSSVTVSSLDDITVVLGDLQAYLAPSEFALSSSYPNPFNPSTSMDLSLNESGYVSVKVYNVMGQIVSTLVDGSMDAGYHTLTWNADNMPSGMYLVRVQAGSNVETQKLMLLK